MSDDHKYRGTGDTIFENEFISISDDGDSDNYVNVNWICEDAPSLSTLTSIRGSLGDEVFEAWLEEIFSGSGADGGLDHSDFEPRKPPAFRCRECGLTTPRSWESDRENVCESCDK